MPTELPIGNSILFLIICIFPHTWTKQLPIPLYTNKSILCPLAYKQGLQMSTQTTVKVPVGANCITHKNRQIIIIYLRYNYWKSCRVYLLYLYEIKKKYMDNTLPNDPYFIISVTLQLLNYYCSEAKTTSDSVAQTKWIIVYLQSIEASTTLSTDI